MAVNKTRTNAGLNVNLPGKVYGNGIVYRNEIIVLTDISNIKDILGIILLKDRITVNNIQVLPVTTGKTGNSYLAGMKCLVLPGNNPPLS